MMFKIIRFETICLGTFIGFFARHEYNESNRQYQNQIRAQYLSSNLDKRECLLKHHPFLKNYANKLDKDFSIPYPNSFEDLYS
jgi:hypothetical protein